MAAELATAIASCSNPSSLETSSIATRAASGLRRTCPTTCCVHSTSALVTGVTARKKSTHAQVRVLARTSLARPERQHGEVGILAVIQEQKKFFEVNEGYLTALHDRQTAFAKLESAVATELTGGVQ